MKALLLILALLPVSLIAQDTLKVEQLKCKKYYTLQVDNQYLSSHYLQKAGRNLAAAGVCMGLSAACGIVSLFLDKENTESGVYYGIAAASGFFMILSVTEFCVAGSKLKTAGIVLTKQKKYTIRVNGPSVKIVW